MSGNFGFCCCQAQGLRQKQVVVNWNAFAWIPYVGDEFTYYNRGVFTQWALGESKVASFRFSILRGRTVVTVSYSSSQSAYEAALAQIEADYGPGGSKDYSADSPRHTETATSLRDTAYDSVTDDPVSYVEWLCEDSIPTATYIDLQEAQDFLDAQPWSDIPVGSTRVWDYTEGYATDGIEPDGTLDGSTNFTDYGVLLGATDDYVAAGLVMCYDQSGALHLLPPRAHPDDVTVTRFEWLELPRIAQAWIGAEVRPRSDSPVYSGTLQRAKGVPNPHCEVVYPQVNSGGMVDEGWTYGGVAYFVPDLRCPVEYESTEIACGLVASDEANEHGNDYAIVLAPRVDQSFFTCCGP